MDFTVTIKGATPEHYRRVQRDLPKQCDGAEVTFNAIQAGDQPPGQVVTIQGASPVVGEQGHPAPAARTTVPTREAVPVAPTVQREAPREAVTTTRAR